MDADRTTMMGGIGAADLAAEEQCPACETSIPSGDEFCPKCGYQRGTWAEGGGAAVSSANGAAPAATATQSGPGLWTVSAGGQSWPLNAGTYAIGRGEVDIVIDDSYASRRHAQLEVTADSVTLTDVGSSNGTFVGERRLEANASEPLADGTTFKVANTELKLAKSQAAADATPQETAEPEGTQVMDANDQGQLQTDSEGTTIDEQAQLPADQEVQEPDEPSTSHWELQRADGTTIPLGFGECTLGRKEPASCVVEGDSYISGVHARLIATEERLEVTDLGSTNGTFVNDARLDPQQPWKLTIGDKLRLGQTSFEVVNNKRALTPGQEEEQRES